MAYVVTNRFPLPTVSRADGTLGAYVQASPVTSGPRFIWPTERIAIYQAQQKAALAAKRKKSFLPLGDITCTIDPVTGGRVCSSSLIPTPPPAPVQTSAPACPACPPPPPCPAPKACAPCPPPRRVIPFRNRILPFVAPRVRALSGLADDKTSDIPYGPPVPPELGPPDLETIQAEYGTKAAEAARDLLWGKAKAVLDLATQNKSEDQAQQKQPNQPQLGPLANISGDKVLAGALGLGALMLGIALATGRRRR